MTYIKKITMHGFKSFVKKTEIPFASGINVVLGPNGSGKSNISDAICFVLGRLNTKSMRASKVKNMIFMGTKSIAPAKEAAVEIVFDNSDETFSLDKNEISIKRIVRKNGLSIYKINGETRTRQEVLSLLAQVEIDPNGFNIVLQGEIQNFARMHSEERRKVMEEVSGISVYESRKEKSLKELEKTEEKLKEVAAILKERTAYLNNLEKERQQALKYKKIEQDIKKYRVSIIYLDLNRKKKEAEKINSDILEKEKEIEKVKKVIHGIKNSSENFKSKIESINLIIQKSTGLEQEKLNKEIADIRAEIAGLRVKTENYDSKISEISRKKMELNEKIRNDEYSIKDLQKESPAIVKKEKDLSAKKQELEKLEIQRKKFYITKSELRSLRERIQDKKIILQNYVGESESLLSQIKSISIELYDAKTTSEKLNNLKSIVEEKKSLLESLNRKEIELEKITHSNEFEINKQEKLMEKISGMDVCPLCKNKITPDHIHSIKAETSPKINQLKKEVDDSDKQLNELYASRELLKKDIEEIKTEIYKRESDMVKISNIEEKKELIKKLQEKIEEARAEISGLEKQQKHLEASFDENLNIEHKYETVKIEVQEISLRSEETINSEISFKQKELERMKISLKQIAREEEDLNDELDISMKNLETKEKLLEKKNKQDEELSEKFKKLISEKDVLQENVQKNELEISGKQNVVFNIGQEINNFKIERARVNAEIENFEIEMLEFSNVEILKMNRDALSEKLVKAKEIFSNLGSVNMRSLEVYDSIKKEYDTIQEKANMIVKEKDGIFKIIHEIDIKKRKTFLNTLNHLNEIFSKNFSQLSAKGQVTLDIENRKDPFDGGVNIVVKTGHGKYFDVTSLSGGEQTLVALSLIFAIQELNPYCFYLLDEIDAALDKRNSERLAALLKKYMKKGQYVVITHNDEIITNATTLYGVSMHEGVSKVTSLRV